MKNTLLLTTLIVCLHLNSQTYNYNIADICHLNIKDSIYDNCEENVKALITVVFIDNAIISLDINNSHFDYVIREIQKSDEDSLTYYYLLDDIEIRLDYEGNFLALITADQKDDPTTFFMFRKE